MVDEQDSSTTINQQNLTLLNLEKLKEHFLQCQSLLSKQDYEEAYNTLVLLQGTLDLLFKDEEFKKTIFTLQDSLSKEHQALLISVDKFLNEDVKDLTLNFNVIKSELASMKTANKMKKAYGG